LLNSKLGGAIGASGIAYFGDDRNIECHWRHIIRRDFIGWATPMRIFHGWWIVAACMLCSLVGNALGLFGAGVYLHEVVTENGWTTGLVSGAVTLFYVVSALLLIPVGSGIKR
jgi:hypothetical protein